ncbi:ABC transporter permease [Devosia sp. Root436]|jgi:ABC-2 type transport system permease protein|uniref:ABC transporter permease n=1 Tax=Devosia sp. Root436 TaxID=1736537 RepID=UPI0006F4B4F5|nr:ABC-2 family transporter protein [Devosia sp. Root436]KQX35524.1 ABC transporter permease [Devosia sp. Root436]
MRNRLAILPLLIRMHVKSQMEYRGAFWLDRLAQIISYGAVLLILWILLQKFHQLGGWNWPELALLFSFQLLAYSLGASMSFTQLRELEELVRLGAIDTLLTKPVNTWAYLIFSGLNIGYVGHIILAIPVLVWALLAAQVEWSVGTALFFIFSLLSATMVTGALMTMIGATALIWVRSNHLFSIFFGFWELTRYPLGIFPTGLQVVMLTIVPLGYISSVPVAVLLGKPVPLLGDLAAPVTLLAGPCLVFIAIIHWRYALNRYQGAGG